MLHAHLYVLRFVRLQICIYVKVDAAPVPVVIVVIDLYHDRAEVASSTFVLTAGFAVGRQWLREGYTQAVPLSFALHRPAHGIGTDTEGPKAVTEHTCSNTLIGR